MEWITEKTEMIEEKHPKVNFGKTGVLLVNLGTPDSTKWFW